jgi:hypothetical protein
MLGWLGMAGRPVRPWRCNGRASDPAARRRRAALFRRSTAQRISLAGALIVKPMENLLLQAERVEAVPKIGRQRACFVAQVV